MNYNDIMDDLYVEFLAYCQGQATSTCLSKLTNGAVSHDQITRALANRDRGPKELWMRVKPLLRTVEPMLRALPADSAVDTHRVLIVDDTLVEKPHTAENEIVCWHWDHCKRLTVKGINIVSLFWNGGPWKLPVDYAVVHKKPKVSGGKPRPVTDKNTLAREMLARAKANGVPFDTVLADSWHASAKTMDFVKLELGKDFVMSIKDNRLAVRVNAQGKPEPGEKYRQVADLGLREDCPVRIRLKGMQIPSVLVMLHVYENEAGVRSESVLCASDTSLDGSAILSLHKKRWSVEVYHKSLKQNTALGKAPLWSKGTMLNHIWASLCAVVRWERIAVKTARSHFNLRAQVDLASTRAAMHEFHALSSA